MDSHGYNYKYKLFPKPPLIPTPEVLRNLLIYNKYSNFVPIIKSHVFIESLYEKLKDLSNDKELIFLLKTLQKIIVNNPDIISLLSPINSNNQFFTTLIEVFLSHCEGDNLNEEILDIILSMCNFIAHNIVIAKAQYKKVYDFIIENKNLKTETTFRLFKLLEILYINPDCIIKKIQENKLPKNYIIHNGEGHIEVQNTKTLFEKDEKYLNFFINFYIRTTGEDMSNLFKKEKNINLEYPSSIMEISMNNGAVFKICLEESYERMFCIFDSSKIKVKNNDLFSMKEEIYWYTNLEEDSWYSLTIKLKHEHGSQTSYISNLTCIIRTIPNNSEPDTSIFDTNIHNLEISKITNIKFYNNFYGLSTSILILDTKEKDTQLNIKKFGIYSKETLTEFNNDNNVNKATEKNLKIKGFSPHRYKFSDTKNSIMFTDLFKKSKVECKIKIVNQFFVSNLNNEHNTTDPLFYIFNLPHIYKNKLKKFSKLGSINQLLPILEVFKRKKCLCQENFKYFFKLLKIMILKNPLNLLDEISKDFFISLAIILETLDKTYFSKDIYEDIVAINNFYLEKINELFDKQTYREKLITFTKHIFFNHRIIMKFDSITWNFILNEIVRFLKNLSYKKGHFSQDKIALFFINNVLTLEGIIQILREIDKFYPTKMCCAKHGLFYGKQSINYKLDKSFKAFEGIFDILMPLIFSANKSIFVSLLRLTILSFSPCMKKFILQRFKQFIEYMKTNEHSLCEFKKYCKDEKIPLIFMHLISISDIISQYKLIHLYSNLFEIDPETFKDENYFNMIKSCLFLNNIHQDNYVSKEFNVVNKFDCSFKKRRSCSSDTKIIDESMIYKLNEPDNKSDMYYSIIQKLEKAKNTNNCELINFYELIPSHYIKKYSDNNKSYLLHLSERFKSLFKSFTTPKTLETEIYKKRSLFLFNCLCIFVSRSNELKIFTLFCELMKELKSEQKKLYSMLTIESKDYFYLLLENYFHLKILQEQSFTGFGSPFIDTDKGKITLNLKTLVNNANNNCLILIKDLFKDSSNLQRFYNFCTFNQLLYKHDSKISYISYIKSFFHSLFDHFLGEIKPDYNNCSNMNHYIILVNILFEFCFVFDHNYELITKTCNDKYSLDNNTSNSFTLPNFFAHWYNEQQNQKIETNLGFILIATFVEVSKSLWNFSETLSLSLTDINLQSENDKEIYIEELVSKHVYPKEKQHLNYYNKLCFLCYTLDGFSDQKYICILKIIAYYHLSLFFAANQNDEIQNQKGAVKMFIFIFSVIILSAHINIEAPKKGTPEEASINKINAECLEVLLVVFGSMLNFYFITTNESLKNELKNLFVLTFNFINSIFSHKKSRRNPSNPIYKLFKDIFLNEKKRNILIDSGKFNIKLKSYNDMNQVIENQKFWMPLLEKGNKEIKKLITNFYQKETIIQNCVIRFINVKNLIPLNTHLFKYHSLNINKIKEFDLKVESPYILLPTSMYQSIKLQFQNHNNFTEQFLHENSQIRRTFNYYKCISLYQNIKKNSLNDLWNLKELPNYALENDELYQHLFKTRFNDSEYVQKFYFDCFYHKDNVEYKGYLLFILPGIIFVGIKNQNQRLQCEYFDYREIQEIFQKKYMLQIIYQDQKIYCFNFMRQDVKNVLLKIKQKLSKRIKK